MPLLVLSPTNYLPNLDLLVTTPTKAQINVACFHPLCRIAEERVVERSKDRVSKLYERHLRKYPAHFDSPRMRCAVRPPLRLRRKEGENSF